MARHRKPATLASRTGDALNTLRHSRIVTGLLYAASLLTPGPRVVDTQASARAFRVDQ